MKTTAMKRERERENKRTEKWEKFTVRCFSFQQLLVGSDMVFGGISFMDPVPQQAHRGY